MNVWEKADFYRPRQSYVRKHGTCGCGRRREWGVALCKECGDERNLGLKAIVVEHRTEMAITVDELRRIAVEEARLKEEVRKLRDAGNEIDRDALAQMAVAAYKGENQ